MSLLEKLKTAISIALSIAKIHQLAHESKQGNPKFQTGGAVTKPPKK